MKTFEEKSACVFERIKEEKEMQTIRRIKTGRIAGTAVLLCLAAAIGVGAWQMGISKNMPEVADPIVAAAPADTSSVGNDSPSSEAPQKSETAAPTYEDSIVVNTLKDIPSICNIALFMDDFVQMEADELAAYYGRNVFADVPADLRIKDNRYGIYRRDGGNGEVYYDMNTLAYANEDGTRELGVIAAKGAVPFSFFTVDSADYLKSVICDREVVVGYDTVTEWYFAGFMCDDVGFAVTANGMTQEEIVSVIRSLMASEK